MNGIFASGTKPRDKVINILCTHVDTLLRKA